MGAWYNPYTGGYGRGAGVYGPYGGVGMGASYNPRTGTYARGAAAYGPYGSRAAGQAYNPRTGTYAQTRQGSNVYGNWGTSSVQRGDDWAQTAHRENYRTGIEHGAASAPAKAARAVARSGAAGAHRRVGRTGGGDVYAGHDGNVYRKNEGGGWEQSNGSGGWSSVDRERPGAQARDRAATGGATAGTTAAGTRDRAATSGATGPARTGQQRADLGQHPYGRSQRVAVQWRDALRRQQLRRRSRGGGARGGGGRRR